MDRQGLSPDAPTMDQLVRDRQGLELWCCNVNCRHHATIPPAVAVWLVGAAVPIALAAKRFRCSVCGARGRDGMVHGRPDVKDFYAAREAAHLADPANRPPRPAERG
jgi:hypothetical protein